ncbi:hypothetical protein OGAPHI_003872 [Ogataea philodendri]|uniref:Mog1p/PsbP-like protein n=1 Tax=Ogataea philodendri TaxID=1378263 RepID=A0A9P8P6R4_9ASCO|nr:uncharacterized protein OGAPHI_003872 [Ogataea philodendri]KAH3665684.1 hypothetical protein OGAPHI_003872 [Ogataea philodendri]
MASYESKQLYGGAIAVDLPKSVIDASDFRQIPDTQEVFLAGEGSSLGQDDAVIFDLLEAVSVPDSEAANYHLQELAKLNGDQQAKVLESEQIALPNFPGDPVYLLVGSQEAKKWGRDSTDLHVVLALVRLRKVQTDLLVTLNLPGAAGFERTPAAKSVVRRALESLKIVNWGLFG